MTIPTFPSFYAETAYNDGFCDARDGTDSRSSFERDGVMTDEASRYYRDGRDAYRADPDPSRSLYAA